MSNENTEDPKQPAIPPLPPADGSAAGYKSVTELAADNPNLGEYLAQLERERDEMLSFIREQVELWDNDGDSGFPLYEQGKRILARYLPPNEKLSHTAPTTT